MLEVLRASPLYGVRQAATALQARFDGTSADQELVSVAFSDKQYLRSPFSANLAIGENLLAHERSTHRS
jgi:hypothetical protein